MGQTRFCGQAFDGRRREFLLFLGVFLWDSRFGRFSGTCWEVLNGVGVDGVGVIFPFFNAFFPFFYAFSPVFFAFLCFS